MITQLELPERFIKKVKVTDTCWLWTSAIDSYGYGRYQPPTGRPKSAHRMAYEAAKGAIPEGLQIDHLCRVRNCVNPDHLEAVTQQENIRRGNWTPAVNARKTHCPRGHAYDEANTYSSGGRRNCRACARDRRRASRKAARGVSA